MANPQMEISSLESVRIERGLSVAHLADRTGISPETLQQRIDRPEDMTLAEISALASELDADVIELLRPILARAA